MRMLIMLRGLPASGKSTWIKDNEMSDFTVSSDALRLVLGSNELTLGGAFQTNQKVSSTMWNMFYSILEKRFQIGAFTVMDATNIKTADMGKAVNLAQTYRYRVYCIDFTDVPVDECIRRDALRDPSKQAGEAVIRRMAESLKGSQLPGGVKLLDKNTWREETRYRLQDISIYKRVHHIGDIHGCATVLQNYLKDGIQPDEFYVFIGDYLDRGVENAEVIDFIHNIRELENVVLLEGNHEIHYKAYLEGTPTSSEEFNNETIPQLLAYAGDGMKKKIKDIQRKLRQCFIYKWGDKVVLCTHGGLSKLPANLSLINTEQLVKGVGLYKDMLTVNASFEEQNKNREVYQVHGHRNVEQVAIQVNSRCFNLCGHIEYGGHLRCLQLDATGFHPVRTPNPVYKKPKDENFVHVADMVDVMKASPYVKVSPQAGTNISSYNFSRDAFTKGIWDGITTKARGLFVNDKSNEIVVRGYDKFFNIDETPATNRDVLESTLQYPVTVYKKENGFLGLVGFDHETDCVLFCSKSELGGEYAEYFKKILTQIVSEQTLYTYLKPQNVTLVFEAIDTVNDPHIIKYPADTVVLLDIIENTTRFKPLDAGAVQATADILGLPMKELCFVLKNAEDFRTFISKVTQDDYKYKGKYIEGFVLSDARLYMTKVKCAYYKHWKYMRGQQEALQRGNTTKVDMSNPFIKWLAANKQLWNNDIITLRELYTHK